MKTAPTMYSSRCPAHKGREGQGVHGTGRMNVLGSREDMHVCRGKRGERVRLEVGVPWEGCDVQDVCICIRRDGVRDAVRVRAGCAERVCTRACGRIV